MWWSLLILLLGGVAFLLTAFGWCCHPFFLWVGLLFSSLLLGGAVWPPPFGRCCVFPSHWGGAAFLPLGDCVFSSSSLLGGAASLTLPSWEVVLSPTAPFGLMLLLFWEPAHPKHGGGRQHDQKKEEAKQPHPEGEVAPPKERRDHHSTKLTSVNLTKLNFNFPFFTFNKTCFRVNFITAAAPKGGSGKAAPPQREEGGEKAQLPKRRREGSSTTNKREEEKQHHPTGRREKHLQPKEKESSTIPFSFFWAVVPFSSFFWWCGSLLLVLWMVLPSSACFGWRDNSK